MMEEDIPRIYTEIIDLVEVIICGAVMLSVHVQPPPSVPLVSFLTLTMVTSR